MALHFLGCLWLGCSEGRTPLLRASGGGVPMGFQRACINDCGKGVQVCRDAGCEACRVAPTEESCSDGCGTGKRSCRDGEWGVCQMDPVERSCSDGCGVGKQSCRDGRWGACQVATVTKPCTSICGTGQQACKDGVWSECDAPQPALSTISGILRDFRSTQPDFELPLSGDNSDPGIVEPLLGPDDTPIYAHTGSTPTVSGPASFAQWFHDVPGVNLSIPYEVNFEPERRRPGYYEVDGRDFFPLDNDPRGFGNEGDDHNYDFTLAASLVFIYRGGEVFSFSADDDLWVFVNRRLALDLGGLHQSKNGDVDLDQQAAALDISPGHSYVLHLFFVERHSLSTDLSIETNLFGPNACPRPAATR